MGLQVTRSQDVKPPQSSVFLQIRSSVLVELILPILTVSLQRRMWEGPGLSLLFIRKVCVGGGVWYKLWGSKLRESRPMCSR